jgi:predicted tellurium resistance membrane protein TerC
MKPSQPLNTAAQISIAAIVLLGMIGGSLIVAHSDFETSPKRGGYSVFVPAPQAYLLAITMYGMSVIGMVALVRERRWSAKVLALAITLYAAAACLLIFVLSPRA